MTSHVMYFVPVAVEVQMDMVNWLGVSEVIQPVGVEIAGYGAVYASGSPNHVIVDVYTNEYTVCGFNRSDTWQ